MCVYHHLWMDVIFRERGSNLPANTLKNTCRKKFCSSFFVLWAELIAVSILVSCLSNLPSLFRAGFHVCLSMVWWRLSGLLFQSMWSVQFPFSLLPGVNSMLLVVVCCLLFFVASCLFVCLWFVAGCQDCCFKACDPFGSPFLWTVRETLLVTSDNNTAPPLTETALDAWQQTSREDNQASARKTRIR